MMRKLLASGLMLVGLAWSAVASTTNCVITVNLTNKSVTISSKLAIRETAYCAITNLGESDATNLVLRITKGTSAYVNATSFVAAASNKAFGAVDLNTSELTNFFYGMNPSVTRSFTLAIWDVALNRLLVNADVDIMNNPYVDGMPGPSPIGVNYLAYNQTNANWRVYGGNLQLYDMADTSWRTIMFRQGSVVAGPSNEPTGAATNIEAFTGMSVMIPYTVPNPQYGFIPSYKGDGLWEARSPTGLAYVATWGDITGTLTNQADLQAVLDTIITNHNDFPDAQGGGASEYYHLTSADYASVTGGITSWDKAATDAAGATADVAVVQGRTGAWEQAVADAASWTNDALSVGNAVNLTNNVKWDKASTDAEGATGDVATLQGRTSVWEKAATDASDATNRVAVMEGSTSAWTKAVSDAADATNRVAVMEGSTSAWTKAASDGVDATNRIAIIEGSTQAWTKAVSDASDATNRVTVIEGRTSVWEQAATDVASATGDVAVLQGRTSVWDTAATDASAATNFLSTNTLQSQITANATGKVSHVEHDAHTNLSLASGAHGGESDPVWAAASNLYATGTPVYVESDPVWSGVSGSVVYADDAGYTQAVEQASRALEWADAASNLASTAYGWGDHAGKYHVTNTLTFNGTTYTVTNEPDAGYVLKFDASNNVCWFAPDDNSGQTYSGDGTTIRQVGNTFSVAPWIPNNLLALRYEVWNHLASYSQGLIDGPGYWFDDEGGILAAASSNQTWANPGYRNGISDFSITEVIGTPEPVLKSHGPAGSARTVWSNKLYVLEDGPGDTNFLSFDGTSWTYEPALEGPHEKASISSYGEYIYAVGGYSALTNCYRFDGSAWAATEGLPAGRHSGGMCEYGGNLYYCGGGQGWLDRKTNVFMFNGSAWSEVPGIPVEDIAKVAVYDGKIYCSASSQTTNAFRFDGSTWEAIAPINDGYNYLSALVSHNNRLFLIRGHDNNSGATTNIYEYTGGVWGEIIGLPSAAEVVGGGGIGGSVFIVTGNIGVSQTNVYELHLPSPPLDYSVAATNTLLSFVPGYAYASALINVGTNSPTTNEVKLFVSRDYGTNWTEAVCEINDTWAVSNKLVTGTASLTNQPTCSNTVVKVEISSNMALTVLGLAAPCSPEE